VRVTIRDVAAQSGVSVNTVSRVINGKQDVSKDTRARVQAVIDEQERYVPSVSRRARESDEGRPG